MEIYHKGIRPITPLDLRTLVEHWVEQTRTYGWTVDSISLNDQPPTWWILVKIPRKFPAEPEPTRADIPVLIWMSPGGDNNRWSRWECVAKVPLEPNAVWEVIIKTLERSQACKR